jgi:hypothetical protein
MFKDKPSLSSRQQTLRFTENFTELPGTKLRKQENTNKANRQD